jgi:hypothetical protein
MKENDAQPPASSRGSEFATWVRKVLWEQAAKKPVEGGA